MLYTVAALEEFTHVREPCCDDDCHYSNVAPITAIKDHVAILKNSNL